MIINAKFLTQKCCLAWAIPSSAVRTKLRVEHRIKDTHAQPHEYMKDLMRRELHFWEVLVGCFLFLLHEHVQKSETVLDTTSLVSLNCARSARLSNEQSKIMQERRKKVTPRNEWVQWRTPDPITQTDTHTSFALRLMVSHSKIFMREERTSTEA